LSYLSQQATERARREAAASATAVDLNTSKQAKVIFRLEPHL